jgi:putative ABC transport system permease protein
MVHTQTVDPDYFRTMQIPLLEGRTFTPADTAVTVINQTLARGFFPHGAIGHQLLLGAPRPDATWLTIVGVIGDVKTTALSYTTMPQFYTPIAQEPPAAMSLVMRTTLAPAALAKTVRTLAPGLPVYDVITMDDRIAKSIGQPRFETTLLTFFAASALFLAAVGIFGVVAHSTAQRTREIGIRMALGAAPSDVLQTIMLQGLKPVIIGVAIGIAGASYLTTLIKSALFQVQPTDPQSFAQATLLLTAVAVTACALPAIRATKIDPMTALKQQ